MIDLHSEKAELAVLGAVLMNVDALGLIGFLEPVHFYDNHRGNYYRAMLELSGEGRVVDVINLYEHISERWALEVGNAALDHGGFVRNVETHGVTIYDKYRRRQMIQSANQIIQWCRETRDTDLLAADSSGLLGDAIKGAATDSIRPIGDVMADVLTQIEKGEEQTNTIKTGIESLDKWTGGVPRGLVTILAGRPGMGKSCVAINIASNMASMGNKVLVTSMEDTAHFIGLRMMARTAGINYAKFVHGKVDASRYSEIVDAASDMSKLSLWIDDKPGHTPQTIRAGAMGQIQREGLDCIVIDHLGEMTKDSDAYASTSTNIRSIRDMAKELNIAVILAVQLNRASARGEARRPVITDLRDSGRIEEVARNIWFVHREGYANYDGPSHGEEPIELLVAKASHGRIGMVNATVNFKTMSVW